MIQLIYFTLSAVIYVVVFSLVSEFSPKIRTFIIFYLRLSIFFEFKNIKFISQPDFFGFRKDSKTDKNIFGNKNDTFCFRLQKEKTLEEVTEIVKSILEGIGFNNFEDTECRNPEEKFFIASRSNSSYHFNLKKGLRNPESDFLIKIFKSR